jgi:hypothetical protein
MKWISAIALAAAISAALLPGSAEAQGRVYKWCLETACGLGGSCQTLCRFESYQQCRASWTPGDRCVQNFYNQRS